MCKACNLVEAEMAALDAQQREDVAGLRVVRVSPGVRIDRVSEVEA